MLRTPRKPRRAVALWVALLVGISALSGAIGTAYYNDFSLPGTESQAALDTLREHGALDANGTIQVVVRADDVAAARPRIERMLEELGRLPHVAAVKSPFDEPGTISRDGRIAYATVMLDGQPQDVPRDAVTTLIDRANAHGDDALRVELTGDAVREAAEGEGGGGAEGAGMLAALVILVFLFGSLIAASLPILTAVFAVGSAMGLIALASHLADIADFTPPMMILVGLGVGIDYALLIFARFRGELLAGRARAQATEAAVAVAGRTVLFAGTTVIIALLGLVALGLGSMQGAAISVGLTVLMTMLASVTLLPALLTLWGARIERTVRKRAQRTDGARWRALADAVGRRPWIALAAGAAVLIALALPAADMRLGFADAGSDDPSRTSRQAYDLLAEGFGPGFSGPLVIVTDADAGAVRDELDRMPGIAATTPAARSPDGAVSTLLAFPQSTPQDPATDELVRRLRDSELPILVGGPTAATSDFSDKLAARFPLVVAIVVGLSALLLMAVFRSVLIPLKAAVFNLLSIGAALGIITLVFQQGWFGAQEGPIEAFLPMMIFAIVFGLSMDYEVFLLSRMHEEWVRGGDAARAVREGLATTGRVITAAAAIMVVVFGAFLLSPDRLLQQFGLGLASAVLLDAVVIRCLMVPAAMRLLGARAWWMPGWIDRRLPQVAVEPS